MPATHDVLDLIGNTPLLELRHLDTGPCRLFAKLEFQNPGGSIKDRIALSMIEAAEASGALHPGDTIIEATAGNTGLGLALVGMRKGYRVRLVMPDKMSREKVSNLRAMGAEVLMTRSDVPKGHPEYYQDVAQRIAREESGCHYIDQFSNPANPEAHERTTGPEIWEQTGGAVDAVVCGVGTGGTLTGVGRFLKARKPAVQMILADPEGSVLSTYLQTGKLPEPGSWLVEGIGEDFVPAIFDTSLVDEAIMVPDAEAFAVARDLLVREGIMAGSSSGTLLAAALRYCRAQEAARTVVTFFADSGSRYLSKMYNDDWMLTQGFIQRRRTGDLRELIAHPHGEHETIFVGPDEPVANALKRMQENAYSQLPVLEGDRVVGILDESDILLGVFRAPGTFREPVAKFMSRRLEVIDYRQPAEDLLPLFDREHVAIVMDGERFLGIITRIDLINHLRRVGVRQEGS